MGGGSPTTSGSTGSNWLQGLLTLGGTMIAANRGILGPAMLAGASMMEGSRERRAMRSLAEQFAEQNPGSPLIGSLFTLAERGGLTSSELRQARTEERERAKEQARLTAADVIPNLIAPPSERQETLVPSRLTRGLTQGEDVEAAAFLPRTAGVTEPVQPRLTRGQLVERMNALDPTVRRTLLSEGMINLTGAPEIDPAAEKLTQLRAAVQRFINAGLSPDQAVQRAKALIGGVGAPDLKILETNRGAMAVDPDTLRPGLIPGTEPKPATPHIGQVIDEAGNVVQIINRVDPMTGEVRTETRPLGKIGRNVERRQTERDRLADERAARQELMSELTALRTELLSVQNKLNPFTEEVDPQTGVTITRERRVDMIRARIREIQDALRRRITAPSGAAPSGSPPAPAGVDPSLRKYLR